MTKNKVEVCVFIPCYNCEKYIKKTINSLQMQTYQAFDIVVVDDGSADHSLEYVQKEAHLDSRIKVYRNEENKGLGYTRNLMFDYCRDYKYVALMDADDLAPEYRLQMEYDYLEKHPEITCVSGVVQFMNEEDELGQIYDDGFRTYEELHKAMIFRDPIANGSVMLRMGDLLQKGLRYRKEFSCSQDYMFFCELVQKCKMAKLPYVLEYYRRYEGNVTSVYLKKKKERNKLIDEIHRYMFAKSGVPMTFLEKKVLCRGYRDTNEENPAFKIIFHIVKRLFARKHPEYERFM